MSGSVSGRYALQRNVTIQLQFSLLSPPHILALHRTKLCIAPTTTILSTLPIFCLSLAKKMYEVVVVEAVASVQ